MTAEINIPCFLRPMLEFKSGSSHEVRLGRYSNSIYRVEGYGKTKWAFSCYIVLEEGKISDYLGKGTTLKEIGIACMNYLNKPPERKKFEKTERESMFGKLSEVVVCSPMPDDMILAAVLVTDQQKNKFIWGKGIKRGKVG